jgi:energy-coupling factor transporter ATPase
MTILFEVNNVSYAHPMPGSLPHRALRDISFQIDEGEYISIVGANGSGKTTLARHLNGLLIPQRGSILFQGVNTSDKNNLPFIHQNVGMVFQQPQEQMIATTIEEDVAFGPENLGLSTFEIRSRVKDALQSVDMWDQRMRSPQYLSAGQTQRVALAGILAMQPKCVIFDEATAMLDPAGRDEVLANITRLHAQGITIIAISHYMEEAALAERMIGLSKGKLVFDGSARELFTNSEMLAVLNLNRPRILSFSEPLQNWIPSLEAPFTLHEFEMQVPALSKPVHFPPLNHERQSPLQVSPFVEINDLSFTYMHNTPLAHQALEKVNLQFSEGSFYGLIGATGSGKSTLLQHFNGLYLPQSGSIRVGPFNINQDTDLLALRRYAGIVFQNPNYQLFEQYVGDEIAYGLRLLGIQRASLHERVKQAMTIVGLDFDTFKDRMTFTLSGGERRKVALASTIVLDPKLLLLDEPTAGLDPLARNEILTQMNSLHKSGKTMVVSSHQLEDLALLTDHVSMLSDGKVVASQPTEQLFSNQQLLQEYGMTSPIAAKMAAVLRSKGWLVPENIIVSSQLITAFQSLSTDYHVNL